MALIDVNESLTPPQKQARKIRASCARLQGILISIQQEIYTDTWLGRDEETDEAVDPQDIMDELDRDAAPLFYAGALAMNIILSQDPTAIAPENYLPKRAPAFTYEPDHEPGNAFGNPPYGTVTLAP